MPPIWLLAGGSSGLHSNLVVVDLEQAPHARERDRRLTAHSDRGSQHLSIRYSEGVTQAGVAASVGRRGDSYDALAETIIGHYKSEHVHYLGPWRGVVDVEVAILEWVH